MLMPSRELPSTDIIVTKVQLLFRSGMDSFVRYFRYGRTFVHMANIEHAVIEAVEKLRNVLDKAKDPELDFIKTDLIESKAVQKFTKKIPEMLMGNISYRNPPEHTGFEYLMEDAARAYPARAKESPKEKESLIHESVEKLCIDLKELLKATLDKGGNGYFMKLTESGISCQDILTKLERSVNENHNHIVAARDADNIPSMGK